MLEHEYNTRYDIESDLMDFRILFAYNSNKIENNEINYHDTREIFENGKVSSFKGDPRTLFEIQNQKNCYDFLIDKIAEKERISISLIKQVHKLLTEGTYDEIRYQKNERPGEFKKGDYIVGKDEVGVEAEEVEKELKKLLDEIYAYNSDDYLTIAAYFHVRFESIHPFADGNGRVGRTMLNYYLMTNGIRPLIVYEEDKDLYYRCLQNYDENDDIDEMKKFLDYCQKKTWQKKTAKNKKRLDAFLW